MLSDIVVTLKTQCRLWDFAPVCLLKAGPPVPGEKGCRWQVKLCRASHYVTQKQPKYSNRKLNIFHSPPQRTALAVPDTTHFISVLLEDSPGRQICAFLSVWVWKKFSAPLLPLSVILPNIFKSADPADESHLRHCFSYWLLGFSFPQLIDFSHS